MNARYLCAKCGATTMPSHKAGQRLCPCCREHAPTEERLLSLPQPRYLDTVGGDRVCPAAFAAFADGRTGA